MASVSRLLLNSGGNTATAAGSIRVAVTKSFRNDDWTKSFSSYSPLVYNNRNVFANNTIEAQSHLNAQCGDNADINVGCSNKFIKRSSSTSSSTGRSNNSIGLPSATSIKSTFLNKTNNRDDSRSINARKMSTHNITVDNINPNYITMEYAVRGPLVIRAGEIEKELKEGKKKPFDQVIRANIGDAHAMGQKPVTFLRQVMALAVNPSLLDSKDFPEDAKKRARDILVACSGQSAGSYTDSYGIELIRHQVADYIAKRDGVPADWNNVILTAGATAGIKGLLSLINCKLGGKTPGIMVPIPQYPLYSATIAEYGMNLIGYYLNESKNWGLDLEELQRSLAEGEKDSCVRALCVINPGNPTGQVLTRKNIEEIIKFAHKNKLMVFADEVYQDNVYDKDSHFFSFKKVMSEMGAPYNQIELASFLSTSKGYLGECGIRGGYMEILNMCPDVKKMLQKSISASLCPTTAGQIACSVLVNPPKEGEPSYEQFMSEKKHILSSLKERAELIYKTFNSFEGFSCNPVQGAMYAFPQIKIPAKAIEEAKKAGKPADVFYASELLETTGICIVPGSGFGQQPGTYHFRTTILPQKDKLMIMLEKFRNFHTAFMQKYK